MDDCDGAAVFKPYQIAKGAGSLGPA